MPRVCAVSYLNTVPLVWGMLHGSSNQHGHGVFDLRFALPSECADQIAAGEADIGIVPVIEMARQKLEYFPGTGIACHGPVRSILLVSHVPAPEIRTMAVDCSSRTSVALAEVILRERFGAAPQMILHGPQLDWMLSHADAALLIGDPALRFHPDELPYHVYDLGQEWKWMTGLPMVFAVWAAAPNVIDRGVVQTLRASYDFGREKIEEIIAEESQRRDFSEELVRQYLTHYIRFELTADFELGMKRFLDSAR